MYPYIPSGKHTKNDGKSTCLMGKSTIFMAIFNSKLVVYPEGISDWSKRVQTLGVTMRA